MLPVEEIHVVKMSWIIPPQQRHYKKKPAYYIAWLIQHQCKGSIYALLKKKGKTILQSIATPQISAFPQICAFSRIYAFPRISTLTQINT